MSQTALLTVDGLSHMIYTVHEQKVMLDEDLASLYGVPVKVLNQAVKRNQERFPKDFAFRLTKEEYENLKSQFVTSSSEWGGRRKLPWAFTEHGILMLSSVLRSSRAIDVNIAITRTFVEMRKMLFSYADLCRRIDALESRYDEQFRIIFDALRQLMAPSSSSENQQKIGFRLD